jgi:hypothetical protein
MQEDDKLTTDVFALLANERRRLLIGYLVLFDRNDSVPVKQLARIVRGIETGTPIHRVESSGYESVYNSLIQQHLPKLERHAVIDYDTRAKEVTVRREIDRYAALLTRDRLC